MEEKKQKTCFIVCPISDEGSETRIRSDKLMKYLIEPVCKELDFAPIRIDQVAHNNSITEEIFKYLNGAELVISDITEHNPNCFYESGYRAALRKPIIFIKNKDVKIPFDIANTRIYDYELDVEAADNFRKSLIETIRFLNFTDSANNKNSEKNESDVLNKILQLLLNIDGKVENLSKENRNSNTNLGALTQLITLLTKNISSMQNRAKSEDEIMLEFATKAIQNPDGIAKLAELIKTTENK